MKSFSQFGSDLDASTVKVLRHGDALLEVLKQEQYAPYSMEHEIFDLFMAKYNYLDEFNPIYVHELLQKAYTFVSNNYPKLLNTIKEERIISNEVEGDLKNALNTFMEAYKSEFINK